MLILFHSPGSCSNGILYLLHELDVPHEARIVDVRRAEQNTETYRAQNPKGKVPALRLDNGQVLTEFQSIAFWLANAYPESGLWPSDLIARTRTLELLDFIVGSIHMRGFTFIKVPGKFLELASAKADLQAHGRAQVEKGLAILSETMGDKDYLLGEFGIADAALLYVLEWAEQEDIAIPANVAACHNRLRQRPAYGKAAALWGA